MFGGVIVIFFGFLCVVYAAVGWKKGVMRMGSKGFSYTHQVGKALPIALN